MTEDTVIPFFGRENSAYKEKRTVRAQNRTSPSPVIRLVGQYPSLFP
nr:MAG TPA: hypothetical protein [Caudoviricetes sp.]